MTTPAGVSGHRRAFWLLRALGSCPANPEEPIAGRGESRDAVLEDCQQLDVEAGFVAHFVVDASVDGERQDEEPGGVVGRDPVDALACRNPR
jgi:hypothetical protein